MNTASRLLFCLSLATLFLTSCGGYQYGENVFAGQYKTVSVPFAKGDTHGLFTDKVIQELSRNGSLRYRRDDGDVTLQLEIVDTVDENVGYRRDRDVNGDLLQGTVPSENRLMAKVRVSAVDSATGKVLVGPKTIAASTIYDFDFRDIRDDITIFSLGQLDFVEHARDAAYDPLYESLAEKVVTYLSQAR